MKKLGTKILKNDKHIRFADVYFLFNKAFHSNLPDFNENIGDYNVQLLEIDKNEKFNKLFEYTLLYDVPISTNNEVLPESAKDIFGDNNEFELSENGERDTKQESVLLGDYSSYIKDETYNLRKLDNLGNEFENFNRCTLAQSDPLGWDGSEVVETFKGYLEINNSYGVLVDSEYSNTNRNPLVFITKGFINKYKLRNGDQIICTCKQYLGNKVLKDIISINGVAYNDWKSFRNNFNDLAVVKSSELECNGEFVDKVVREFKLMKGDTTFMYVNLDSSVEEVLKLLIKDISATFDTIIYINPNYISHSGKCPDCDNLVKFCTKFNETFTTQANISLLAVHYAKRLVEQGKKVGIIVDDINTIAVLDKDSNGEMPISKNILSCAQNTEAGSINVFAIIPVRPEIISNLKMQDVFRSLETVGWVVRHNSIDVSSSFRTR